MKNKVRLQKFMAEAGVASRRSSEELIAAGKVKVNGRSAKIGDSVDPIRDKVTVSGKTVVAVRKKVYIMLHKPRGFVTTLNDELGRKSVDMLVDGQPVFPSVICFLSKERLSVRMGRICP